ncbi:MAG TPA: DUF4105 domain-containing protein [Rhodothermales bacterium]|nr:DUF4105 domain-containing protein [Rhodothermales bacterium]
MARRTRDRACHLPSCKVRTSNLEPRTSNFEQPAPNERTRNALKENNPKRARRGRTSNLELRTSNSRRSHKCLWGLLVCVTFFTGPSTAQDAPRLTDRSVVSVITILPGDPLYSAFGHTAIRVRDDSAGIDVGYNYGTFDFDEEGFYIKFLRGKLDYVLARNPFDAVLYSYQMEERPVLEQRLNLTLEERQALFDRLEVNYLPENRAYRYDFLFDNCSTRPRDVIEAVWGHRMTGAETQDVATFRNLIDRYLRNMPWTRFGIDILLGSPTDVVAPPRDRMFLPDEFLYAVEAARAPDGQLLSAPTDTLYWPTGYERWTGATPWPAVTGWILLLAVAGLTFLSHRSDRLRRPLRMFDGALFLTIGILGVVIALLWFATEHTLTKTNWNLIWALPTHAVLGVALLRDARPPWLVPYLWLTIMTVAITAIGWTWIPQEFTPWIVPYLGIVAVRAGVNVLRWRRPTPLSSPSFGRA